MVDLRRFTTWFNNGAGEFRLGGSIETENKVDQLVVADVNFDGLDDVITIGDRRTEGGFVFGTFLPDTIEPNRLQVYANDGLEGLVEVRNVPDGSPFDTDSCKGTAIKNVFPLLFGPRSLVLAGFSSKDIRDPNGFLLFGTPSLTFSSVATGDGHFKPATCTNPSLPKELPSIQGQISKSSIPRPATLPPPLSVFKTDSAFSGRFRNRLQGTQFPELAATGMLTTVEMQDGFCPGQSFAPPRRASTCEKIDTFCGPGDCNHDIIQFGSDGLGCSADQTPSCHGQITPDGLCKGADKCFCAASSPGPTACQTTRTYGPLVFTFASCM
jgi:hypothetical protein